MRRDRGRNEAESGTSGPAARDRAPGRGGCQRRLGAPGESNRPTPVPGVPDFSGRNFGVVLSDEIWLELDDSEVHLKPGDCVVQRGSMHAWRNRSDKPCVMSFVLIEAGSKENG